MGRYFLIQLFLIPVWLWPCLLMAQNSKQTLLTQASGYDAYRMWADLPRQRIGVRAYMRSTYDRGGGGYDAANFLFMKKEDENVTLDVKGRGTLWFFRANHWHGSPWHFIVDGKDQLIKETATADPVDAVKKYSATSFIPEKPLPQPLAWTWGITKGADLLWIPMGFRDSLQIAYSRTFYGTGYYIYHLYANTSHLTTPVTSWNSSQVPPADVMAFVDRAGTDIAPKNIQKVQGKIKLDREDVVFNTIRSAPATLRALKLTLPLEQAERLERAHLRVTWDDALHPSIDAPLCLFFGAGTFFNREQKEYLVKGLPINIRYDYSRKLVELSCYYPMPFFRSAKFELAAITPGAAEISYELRFEKQQNPAPQISSYFHATYRDFPKPELGQDMTWLDTKGTEGHQDWTGSFLGTSFIFSHNANLNTLEGDPRFFFDDSQSPQAYGTGTEEWAGGGDYWGGENMTLPLAGHPCGAIEKKKAVNEKDLIQSAYRFLWTDLMPFGKRAVIRFEHNENVSQEHYETVCYWYGLPAASLLLTDSLDVGNIHDEQKHEYKMTHGDSIETFSSRFEWGPSAFPAHAWGYDLPKKEGYKELIGKEIYPPQQVDGRATFAPTEFNLQLQSDNWGVLLRRMLDYSYPNQTAVVYIADGSGNKPVRESDWKKAGVWYLAGSNTWMASAPKEELSPRIYNVRTSNRRLREDEFLVPATLTRGLKTIRVRIRPIPDHQELYPGHPFPKPSKWSALQYKAYSYMLPEFNPGK